MAKNTIYLDVVVDDKGTTKRVAVDSTRLADAMSRTARNSAEADRNIKGAAQASSNATKNFSKMSQGMGGLVAAYATIAAQVFALSAAYQFLLQAADLRILIEGQKALTQQTGVAYTSITKSIQAATDAQLGYKQAAQAAAIGTAAGLSATMLKDIASYSQTISAVLGRDLEDTFNRLIRGITKAEPELLDELGIVLRLADATSEYARTLGKTANELTAYERTQGVAIFTLKQAEEKYGDLNKAGELSANGIRQLGAAFSELANKILPEIAGVAEFLANSIRGNVAAVASTFGLLLAGVVGQILPSAEDITRRTDAALEKYSNKIADYTIQADAFARGQLTITKRVQPAVDSLKGLASSIQRVQGAKASPFLADIMNIGERFDPRQVTTMQDRIEAELTRRQAGARGKARDSLFVGIRDEQLREFSAKLGVMTTEAQKASEGMSGAIQTFGTTAAATATRTKLIWASTMRTIQVATLGAVRVMNAAFRALGAIGLFLTLLEVAKSVYAYLSEKFGKKEIVQKSLAEQLIGSGQEVDAAKARIEDLERAGKGLESIRLKGTFEEVALFAGNMSSNISQAVDSLVEENNTFVNQLADLREISDKINRDKKEFSAMRTRVLEGGVSMFERVELNTINESLKNSSTAYKEVNQAIDKLETSRKESLTNTALELAAYAKSIPELRAYGNEVEYLVQQNDFYRLSTSKAIPAIKLFADNANQASGAIRAYAEGFKTLNKEIIDSVSLTPLQKRLVQVSSLVKNLSDALRFTAANTRYFGTDVNKTKQTLTEFTKILKMVADANKAAFDVAQQENYINSLKDSITLFSAENYQPLSLLAELDEAELSLQIGKIQNELTSLKLDEQLFKLFTGENELILSAAALDEAGRASLAAGAANANKLKTEFSSATEEYITKLKEENDNFLTRYSAINETQAPKREEAQPQTAEQIAFADVFTKQTSDFFFPKLTPISSNAQTQIPLRPGATLPPASSELSKEAKEAMATQSEMVKQVAAQNQALKEQDLLRLKILGEIKVASNNENRILQSILARNKAQESALTIQNEIDSFQQSTAKKLEAQVRLSKELTTLEVQDYSATVAVNKLQENRLTNLTNQKNITDDQRKVYEDELSRLKAANGEREIALRLEIIRNAVQRKEAQRQAALGLLKEQTDTALNLLNIQQELSNLSNPYIQEELKERLEIEKTTTSLLALEKEIEYTSKAQLPALKDKIIAEKARLTVLQEQEKEINKISQAVKGAFGQGIEQEIAAFLKGGQIDIEASFLNIVKSVGEAAADQMAKIATNFILDGLGLGEESEAEKINSAMKEAANYAESVIGPAMSNAGNSTADAIKAALSEVDTRITQSLKNSVGEGGTTASNTIKTAMEEAARYTANLIKEAYAQVQPKMPMEEQKEEIKLPQTVPVSGIEQVSKPTTPPIVDTTPLSVKVTGIEELEACIVRALSTGALEVEQAIGRAFQNVTLPSIKEVESVSKPTTLPEVDTTSLSVKVTGIEELEACIVRALSTGALEVERAIGRAFQNANLSIKPPALPTPNDNPLIQEVQVTAQRLPVPDKSSTTSVGMTIANGAKKIGTDIRNFGNKVQDTFASDAPFLDKLGSIFNADAPWINSMTRGLAGALGGIAVGALGGGGGNAWRNAIIGGVVSGLSFGFTSWLGGLGSAAPAASGAASLTPVRMGGTASYSSTPGTLMVGANGGIAMGGFRAFAEGGIVNKPTLGLVGEGRYNEAVVPLPDGKSIPVIMQSGGGDRNNIGININVNSGGQMQSDAQATGERGVAMAQAIQNVVQLELKRQKRPGGLLSPF